MKFLQACAALQPMLEPHIKMPLQVETRKERQNSAHCTPTFGFISTCPVRAAHRNAHHVESSHCTPVFPPPPPLFHRSICSHCTPNSFLFVRCFARNQDAHFDFGQHIYHRISSLSKRLMSHSPPLPLHSSTSIRSHCTPNSSLFYVIVSSYSLVFSLVFCLHVTHILSISITESILLGTSLA